MGTHIRPYTVKLRRKLRITITAVSICRHYLKATDIYALREEVLISVPFPTKFDLFLIKPTSKPQLDNTVVAGSSIH